MIALALVVAWVALGWLGTVLCLRALDLDADWVTTFTAVLVGPANLVVAAVLWATEREIGHGVLNKIFLVR